MKRKRTSPSLRLVSENAFHFVVIEQPEANNLFIKHYRHKNRTELHLKFSATNPKGSGRFSPKVAQLLIKTYGENSASFEGTIRQVARFVISTFDHIHIHPITLFKVFQLRYYRPPDFDNDSANFI